LTVSNRGRISVSTIRASDEHPRTVTASRASGDSPEGEHRESAEALELSKWRSTSCMIVPYPRELGGIEIGDVQKTQAFAPDVTFPYCALSDPRHPRVKRTIVYFKIYVNLD
jgi:hypothetical protein